MIKDITKVMTADAFVGYINKKKPLLDEDNYLQKLFPVYKVNGLDYSFIKTTNGVIELTAPSAFDAEPISQHRKGFDAMKGELPLFRKKMNLSEKEKVELDLLLRANQIEGFNSLIAQIYDDQTTLISGARMTQEFLRSRVLMDGKITMNSKGGAVAVDYKVPAANKHTLSGDSQWSDPTAKIIDQVNGWLDAVEEETGVRPSRMLMNKKTFKLLRTNKQIVGNIIPITANLVSGLTDNAIITDTRVMATFKELTGIDEVVIYNRKVSMDGTTMDLIEDNKVVIFPDGDLGKTLIGTSPAEVMANMANNAGASISIAEGGIAVNVLANKEAPYTMETQVEFIGLPSLPMADFIVQATVA